MHVPEGNVLRLPFMGHPNMWWVHVGAVVHVGIWIRCFQTLYILPLPTVPLREELLAGIPSISPWIPCHTGRAGVPVCCSCVPWPWLGLLGFPMFQRHLVRLILVGCETWVSHRLE